MVCHVITAGIITVATSAGVTGRSPVRVLLPGTLACLNRVISYIFLSMDNYGYYIPGIAEILRVNPEGMTVSEIALTLRMSRNTIGKYLEIMYLSGMVDYRSAGKARLYYPAPRVPITRILNFLSESVIQTDERFRIRDVNAAARDLLGEDDEDLIGRNILDILCIQGMSAELRGVITDTGQDTAIAREMIIHRDGEARVIWMTVAEIVMFDGAAGHVFILEDITEWRDAEEKKMISGYLFSTLAQESFEQVCLFSSDFTLRYQNACYAAEAEAAASERSVPGRLEVYDKKTARLLRDQADQVLEQGTPGRVVFPVSGPGSTRWLDARFFPVPVREGRVTTLLGITRDITGLQEGGSASGLLTALLRTMDEGVLTVTVGGTILSWNRGAEKITGYPAEELLGGMAQIVIPPELNGGQDVIIETVRGGVITDLRMTIRAKGGRKKKVIMSTTPVTDHAGEISLVVLVWRESRSPER